MNKCRTNQTREEKINNIKFFVFKIKRHVTKQIEKMNKHKCKCEKTEKNYIRDANYNAN